MQSAAKAHRGNVCAFAKFSQRMATQKYLEDEILCKMQARLRSVEIKLTKVNIYCSLTALYFRELFQISAKFNLEDLIFRVIFTCFSLSLGFFVLCPFCSEWHEKHFMLKLFLLYWLCETICGIVIHAEYLNVIKYQNCSSNDKLICLFTKIKSINWAA